MRRQLRGPALRFLLYAVVCLVLLAGLVVKIGNVSLFSHRVTYRALMSDVTGLDSGDNVTVAGVSVGQVSQITTDHGQALVTFGVNQSVRLPRDTQVGLRWENVLGQMYLQLYPTGAGGPYLPAGATIPERQDVGDADIGAFINALGPVLQSINPVEANAFVEGVVGGLQGNLAQVGSLIDNAATVSNTVGSLDVQVGSIIDNLSTVIGTLGGRRQDLQDVVSNLATISAGLASRNNTLDQVVENFSVVSGDFARLLSGNRGNLDTLISGLDTVADTLRAHKADLNTDLSTLSSGLEPYTLISSYGQWFNIQVVYLCLANELSCQYQEGGAKPSQTTTAAGPAGPGRAPAPSAAGLSSGGIETPGGSTLGDLLAHVAGAGS